LIIIRTRRRRRRKQRRRFWDSITSPHTYFEICLRFQSVLQDLLFTQKNERKKEREIDRYIDRYILELQRNIRDESEACNDRD
jgi:hypothetical protein